MEYCCEKLREELEEGAPITHKKVMVNDLQRRAIGLSYDGTLRVYQPIEYCPFCGHKFEKDLIEEYWEYLIECAGQEYYPIDENYDPNKPLPEEFKTDEWWKKRGL